MHSDPLRSTRAFNSPIAKYTGTCSWWGNAKGHRERALSSYATESRRAENRGVRGELYQDSIGDPVVKVNRMVVIRSKDRRNLACL